MTSQLVIEILKTAFEYLCPKKTVLVVSHILVHKALMNDEKKLRMSIKF